MYFCSESWPVNLFTSVDYIPTDVALQTTSSLNMVIDSVMHITATPDDVRDLPGMARSGRKRASGSRFALRASGGLALVIELTAGQEEALLPQARAATE